MDRKAQEILNRVVNALESKGYDAEQQLTGYVLTGNDLYITQKDGARDAVKLLDKKDIREYLDHRSG